MDFFSLDIHLFIKIPRPGDSEHYFRSMSQAVTCYYQSNKVVAKPNLSLYLPYYDEAFNEFAVPISTS